MMNLSNLLNSLSSKLLLRIVAIISLVGIADTIYLTTNHYLGSGFKCLLLEGCEVVLVSPYSVVWGIPLAVFGLIFYAGIFVLVNLADIYGGRFLPKILVLGGAIGFLASISFLYIQAFILKAFCFYCLISFVSSTLIFILTLILIRNKEQAIFPLNQN